MSERPAHGRSGLPLWGRLPSSTAAALLRDLPIVVAVLALFYGLLALTHYWTQPVNTQPPLHLEPGALPLYALYSLARILVAYLLSLLFAVVYGQVAAHNPKAERILIPLLDTLQSIPVLSFLPPVMAAMVALFPTRQFGVELGSILLIFTGQVWNMAFSVYSSTKNIPHELVEAAAVFRLNWWQRFTQLEMPCAAIGLVWNSMMSVAGGWFFLMACEAFVLGNSVRLPGLGSYLQTAADNADTRSIVWGLATMIAVIVLMDQLLWRPIIAWAEKFKFEQVEGAQTPRSPILALRRANASISISRGAKPPRPFIIHQAPDAAGRLAPPGSRRC
jgi:NitT/TauT family transport system permease protein